MKYPVTAEVVFKGDILTTIQDGGIEYVAMRPVVESIGLDWASQTVKLNKEREKYGCCDIATPSRGGIQNMLCIPLRKLNGWLFSINPNKVKATIRDKLISYQEECFAVLHDYWTKGIAVNPRRLSVMEELNQACADMKRDKGIASLFGTGLNEWKSVKAAHVSKIRALVNEANMLIEFVLADTGKGKITRT
ncbi:hypothetical protein EGD47_21020 [Salmonella enterica]|uniref:Uncharacterized protein n=1 Tax=Salmonella enterica subsp. enterica serovar Poona TaxID=436295 RepID=A0A5V6NKR0_SALET|nr:phage antirepressor N-terminal domain-containing protein [Escherichia coli]EAP4731885.1 hypothetical protein [Salmonella enterica]EBS4766015.1 hypothetical protein [Salmonella enterica subsp. enterica serovar Poona]EEL6963908.1 hypothetical protein [Salmonella enterica subsp. enterica serovar Muenchen]EHK9248901.1 hypothetical protein [Salmonella enterica subsp. enterica serovar Panama]EBB1186796.1 hypothetical protein [Salmonella enterica]